MNVLVVSSYPPMACGIGAYADQQVQALRRDGLVVNVYTPPEGEGDFRGNLVGGMRVLRLARILWAYDRVYFHYVPNFFYDPMHRLNRLKTSLALLLLALFFGRRMHFIIHETDYKIDEPETRKSSRSWLDRWMWRMLGSVIFHSTREREVFAKYYRLNPSRRQFQVVEHDRHFISRYSADQQTARRELSIPADRTLFLCIGFVQPHKGFDRVIRALRQVNAPKAMLRIVGSVRIQWQPAIDFARLLHEESANDPRSQFIETFVSDDLFDRWIVAADYVMIPYHEIWSSGVAARAKLHGKPIIVSDTGGLSEQMTEGSYKFKTDEELVAILERVMGARA